MRVEPLATSDFSPMPWKMRCPKCQGTDYEVKVDRSAPIGPGKYDFVYHCRCGKMIFGEANIKAEQVRQWDAYVKMLSDQGTTPEEYAQKKAEELRVKREGELARERAALEARRRVSEAKVAAEQAERAKRLAEAQAWTLAREAEEKARDTQRAIETRRAAHAERLATTSRKLVLVNCSVCGAPVGKHPYEVRRSKSGKFYCCLEHYTLDRNSPSESSCKTTQESPSPTDPSWSTSPSEPTVVGECANSLPDDVSSSPLPETTGSESSPPSPTLTSGSESGPPSRNPGRCAWQPCEKDAEGKSKYCSRTCSNKYSHMRSELRDKNVRFGRPTAILQTAAKWKVDYQFVEAALAS